MSSSKILLSFAASACIATLSSAMEFQVLGAKAASMGGAGIATSPSSLAAYNNPALLANNPEKFSIHLGGGLGVKDTGAGKAVGDLSDMDFSGIMEMIDGNAEDYYNVTSTDVETLKNARDVIVAMDQKGFAVNPSVDLAFSYGSFGTGAFVTSDIGAVANIDQSRTALIFAGSDGRYYDLENIQIYNTDAEYTASSLDYAVQNGTTNLDIVGLAVAEIPLAYGHAFDTGYGSLAVGGALKLMAGQTFYKKAKVDDDNAFDSLDQNTQDTTTFGIDLGLAYKPAFAEGLTLALVGKNLNSPTFDVSAAAKAEGASDYQLDPMVRAGAAYKLNDWVEFALDADITKNKSITMYDTQYIGGGANIDLKYLELNLGLMKNIAPSDVAGAIYTAGIATGPDWLHFELSAQMASQTGEIDGTAYPKQAMVNFAISSAW